MAAFLSFIPQFHELGHIKNLFPVTTNINLEQCIKKNSIFHFADFDVFDTLSGRIWVEINYLALYLDKYTFLSNI